jgi:integrase
VNDLVRKKKIERRESGDGSIFLRGDGRWVARVENGYTVKDGKPMRVQKTVYGKTRDEVRDKLLKLQTAGPPVAAERQTVEQYLSYWLEATKGTVRDSTYHMYRMAIAKVLASNLARLKLTSLTPLHIQKLYADLQQTLSAKRVNGIHAVLRRAINRAVAWDMLVKSPIAAEKVTPPLAPRVHRKTYDGAMVRDLIRALVDEPLGCLYYLAIATGMRRGELCGLRWGDVDLERNVITVVQSATPTKGKRATMTDVKTDGSRRTVTLPPDARGWLQRHRNTQEGSEARPGALTGKVCLLFVDHKAQPVVPGGVSQKWKLLLARLDMPHIRLHDLRHTHATLLLEAGVKPKTIADRLGHSSIVITQDLYAHVTDAMRDDATDAIEAIIAPRVSSGCQPPAKIRKGRRG